MNRHLVEIDGTGDVGVVLVDGLDLSAITDSLSVRWIAGKPPRVELGLGWPRMKAALPNTVVELDEPTRNALILLGWTPPVG